MSDDNYEEEMTVYQEYREKYIAMSDSRLIMQALAYLILDGMNSHGIGWAALFEVLHARAHRGQQ
jgi:hypothetical protein